MKRRLVNDDIGRIGWSQISNCPINLSELVFILSAVGSH